MTYWTFLGIMFLITSGKHNFVKLVAGVSNLPQKLVSIINIIKGRHKQLNKAKEVKVNTEQQKTTSMKWV